MKITIIGASQIALSVAWGVCESELAQQVVFFNETQSGSKLGSRTAHLQKTLNNSIEDMTLATAMNSSDTKISYTSKSDDISETDVAVFLPASLPYGFHSSQALKTTNLSHTRHIAPKIQEHIQNAIILIAMPYANYIAAWLHQNHGLNNIIGVANGVTTAHLKSEIATRLGISVKDVSALAIGNDEVTHPLTQYCRVNGIHLSQLMNESDIQSISEVVTERCPYTSSSDFTLASHILQVVSTISLDKKRVMSVGTLISTDTTSVFLNVPSKIGSNGIENIIPLELTDTQTEQFKQLVAQSAASQNFS